MPLLLALLIGVVLFVLLLKAVIGLVPIHSGRIELETARHRITGSITLSQNGFRSRISDMLNASEREFISLTEATIVPLEGDGAPVERPFVAVSRAHIVRTSSSAR